MFQKEVRKGPHVYGMEEKAYWEALTSYTAELFSDAPTEQARGLRRVREGRAWYYLGKLAKAHPNTKEAAAYRMYSMTMRTIKALTVWNKSLSRGGQD